MWGKLKWWDNRKETKANRLPTINQRTWTRRIQWLVSDDFPDKIKLKLEDGETYKEVCVLEAFAQTVWDRFKEGQSIEDAVSIHGGTVVSPSRKHERKSSSPGDSHEVGGVI